jgi:hypothetical protein
MENVNNGDEDDPWWKITAIVTGLGSVPWRRGKGCGYEE